jgi:hypothetical protein
MTIESKRKWNQNIHNTKWLFGVFFILEYIKKIRGINKFIVRFAIIFMNELFY